MAAAVSAVLAALEILVIFSANSLAAAEAGEMPPMRPAEAKMWVCGWSLPLKKPPSAAKRKYPPSALKTAAPVTAAAALTV